MLGFGASHLNPTDARIFLGHFRDGRPAPISPRPSLLPSSSTLPPCRAGLRTQNRPCRRLRAPRIEPEQVWDEQALRIDGAQQGLIALGGAGQRREHGGVVVRRLRQLADHRLAEQT